MAYHVRIAYQVGAQTEFIKLAVSTADEMERMKVICRERGWLLGGPVRTHCYTPEDIAAIILQNIADGGPRTPAARERMQARFRAEWQAIYDEMRMTPPEGYHDDD